MTGRSPLVGFFFAALVGCGSSSGPSTPTPGSATFTGALTGTVSIIAVGTYESGDDAWGFAITNNTTTYPNLNFAGQFAGTSLAMGTYTTANSQVVSTLVSSSATGNALWTQTFDPSTGAPTMGTFSLTISSPGPAMTGTGNTGWDQAHGGFTATTVPEEGNSSASNVTVNVTF